MSSSVNSLKCILWDNDGVLVDIRELLELL